MKRTGSILGGLLALLTLAGSIHVLRSGGRESPGFAMVPLVLCLSLSRLGDQP